MDLSDCYPSVEVSGILDCLEAEWLRDPVKLLDITMVAEVRHHLKSPTCDETNLYIALQNLGIRERMGCGNNMLRRIVTVALSVSYLSSSSVEAVAERIAWDLSGGARQDQADIVTSLHQYQLLGQRWQRIIYLSGVGSGVIVLLCGAARCWDVASDERYKLAFDQLILMEGFTECAKRLTSIVDQVLEHLARNSSAKDRNYHVESLEHALYCLNVARDWSDWNDTVEGTLARKDDRFRELYCNTAVPLQVSASRKVIKSHWIPKDDDILWMVHIGDISGLSALQAFDLTDHCGMDILTYAAEHTLKCAGPYTAIMVYSYLLGRGVPQTADVFCLHPILILMDGILFSPGGYRRKLHYATLLADTHGMRTSQLFSLYLNYRHFGTAHWMLIQGEFSSRDANVNVLDELDRSALSLAVEFGNHVGVKKLVELGANIHIRRPTVSGYTSILHLACDCPVPLGSLRSERKAIVQFLVTRGADLFAVNGLGLIPQGSASSWGWQ